MTERLKKNDIKLEDIALQGQYAMKKAMYPNVKSESLSLLFQESSKRSKESNIPTSPTTQDFREQSNFSYSSGNINSRIALSKPTALNSLWSGGFSKVVATEEEGNGYGLKDNQANVKQEQQPGQVTRLPPIRRKSNSSTNESEKDRGQETQSMSSLSASVNSSKTSSSADTSAKTTPVAGSSPRVSLIQETATFRHRFESCREAFAQETSERSLSLPSSHAESSAFNDENSSNHFKDSHSKRDVSNTTLTESMEERDTKNVPTPHTSPCPSSEGSIADGCGSVSVYSCATVKANAKESSLKSNQKPSANNTTVSEKGAVEFIHPKSTHRQFYNTSRDEEGRGYYSESDMDPTILVKILPDAEIWRDDNFEESTTKYCSDQDRTIQYQSDHTEALFNSLGDQDPANVLKLNPVRRRNHHSRDTGKRTNDVSMESKKPGKKQTKPSKRKANKTEQSANTLSNVVPLATSLGQIGKSQARSLECYGTECRQHEKMVAASPIESRDDKYQELTTRNLAIHTSALDSGNQVSRIPLCSQQEASRKTQEITSEKVEKASRSSQRSSNIKKTKQVHSQRETKQEKDAAEKNKPVVLGRSDEKRTFGNVASVTTGGSRLTGRNLVDLTNLQPKQEEREISSREMPVEQSGDDKDMMVGTVATEVTLSKDGPQTHDCRVEITENSYKDYPRAKQEWSKDGVDVFGQKLVVVVLLIWSFVWSFTNFCPCYNNLLQPEKAALDLMEPANLHHCAVFESLLPVQKKTWNLSPAYWTDDRCPSLLETLPGYNRCPATRHSSSHFPDVEETVVSHADIVSPSSVWTAVQVLGLLGLSWYIAAPKTPERQRTDNREHRGRSRSRSVTRTGLLSNTAAFGSPFSSVSFVSFAKRSINTVSSKVSDLQDYFQRDVPATTETFRRESSHRAPSAETDFLRPSNRASPAPIMSTYRPQDQARGVTKSPSPSPQVQSASPSRSRFEERASVMSGWSDAESVRVGAQRTPTTVSTFSPVRTRSSTRRNI